MQLQKNIVMLDANMILRFLVNDNLEMATIARLHIESNKAYVTLEVISEVVYVLKRIYSIERKDIADKIAKLVEMVSCDKHDVIILALVLYGTKNLDFIDCVLCAYHKLYGVEIATFDQKLLKLLSKEE